MRPQATHYVTPRHDSSSPRASKHFSLPIPTDTCKADPFLATVIDSWPTLPEALKAGVVAIVTVAGK